MNMKTLKTISLILPMTLLLACGGGSGGGYSALPTANNPQEIEPTITPTTLTLRADSMSFVPDDVDTDDTDTESYAISTEAADIKVTPPPVTERYNSGPYEFKRMGKWFHVGEKPGDSESFFWFGKWQGKEPKYLKGWHHAGDEIKTHIQGNSEFAGAVYTGKSIVKRKRSHGGGIREGDARININGDFTVDFLFSNIEGIADLSYQDEFVDDVGVTVYGQPRDTVESSDFREKGNGKVKNGVQAKFYGSEGDAIGGFFRDIEAGVKRGAFGATRDTVEIK